MMVNWQVTAATLRCGVVDEEVTLLVYKDWSVKCTGHARYARTVKGAGRTSKKKGPSPGCEGTDCQLANDYRKKLQSEEKRPAA
jgi:hypothetical protein